MKTRTPVTSYSLFDKCFYALVWVVIITLAKLVQVVVCRCRVTDARNVPAEGPVLLTPNHVSFLDSAIVYMSSPRRVRFVIMAKWYEKPLAGAIAKAFNSIPISRDRPREGMRLAVQALREGDVVCMFPEGRLTRDGGVRKMMPGFVWVARKANCLVVPVRMSGLHGAAFCVRPGWSPRQLFTSSWRRVEVAFGNPISSGDVSVKSVQAFLGDARTATAD